MSLDFRNLGLDKEIIIVDGGSNDKSINICKKFKNIKIYSLKNKKRGEVLNYGISKSKGDIIVTFPSDNEYLAQDIIKIINQLYLKDTFVVYGSRMIKNYKHTTHLKKIYKNNYLLYWISKIGGLLISLLILVFYNKYISDPFTSLKAFRSETIKDINNNFKGVDYDIYQIIQLTKKRVYINEIEVNYFARSYKEGKKTNIIEGLKSLLVIFRSLFFNSKMN
jgi:glycosyltransferase involved in cell wall biosynthesis